MRSITVTVRHPSLSDVIRLYPLGDVHVGVRACQEAAFSKTVKEIAGDPLARWIGMGDYCDFISVGDPRFRASALADWVDVADLDDLAAVQRDRFLGLVETIADKCLALVRGNHEDSILRYYERDVYQEIVAGVRAMMKKPPEQLGLGFSGFVRVRVVRVKGKKAHGHSWPVDVFAHHGYGGGRLAGSKALKLERALLRYQADLVLIGHWHTMQFVPGAVIGMRRSGRLRKRGRKGVVTGCWLEGHPENGETYAEVAGYPPQMLGCPVVELHPRSEIIRVVV